MNLLLILALLFAIPTFGGSLVAYFVYVVYGLHRTSQKIEEVIQFLSDRYPPKDGTPLGTAISWLRYSAVLGYAQSDRCQILDQVGTYVQFKVVLNAVEYQVTLNKVHDANTPIMTSTTALQRLRHWMKYCALPDKLQRMSDADVLNIETLAPGSVSHSDLVYNKNSAFLPEEINLLQNLGFLGLQYKGLTSLAKSIGDLSALQVLKLGGNNLATLPPEIGKLRNLKVLTVWMNNLTYIPKEIGLLANLEGLDLTMNPLLATLPDEIVMLTNLKRLYLDPKLQLTPRQERWIHDLEKKGCDRHG